MKLTHARAAGLALLLAASTAGAGYAQSTAAVQPPSAEAGKARWGDPAQREARIAQRKAQMTQRLRDTLQLTPAQEPALQQYLAALRPDGARPERRERRQARSEATTPQRLDQQRARLTERLAAFDRRAAATRAFYGQLTAAQQKAFDAQSMSGRRGGGRDQGGFGGRGGPGRHG